VTNDDRAILSGVFGGMAVLMVAIFIMSVWKNDR